MREAGGVPPGSQRTSGRYGFLMFNVSGLRAAKARLRFPFRNGVVSVWPAIMLLLFVVASAFVPAAAAKPDVVELPMSVHFFDVDQGDSTLLLGEDFTIVIDAGRHDRSEVVDHLRRAGVEAIDLFILTHPHADHIGQCAAVLENFPVGEVWMSGDEHTTLTFERCLDAIIDSDAGYYEPRAGESFVIGGATLEVVHPAQVTGDLNDGSVGVRIVYGDVAFLLTGDAETRAEREMLARGHDLTADVLKLGHHGSRTSSRKEFVKAVDPKVAVYSAGRCNTYGHPHEETLRTLQAAGVTVYGTDVHGTVVVHTDGERFVVAPERGSAVLSCTDGDPIRRAGSDGGSEPVNKVADETCAPHQVNINTASEDELTRIIHIGPVLAARIVAERPFRSIDELLRVPGIGEKRLADIIAQGVACVC